MYTSAAPGGGSPVGSAGAGINGSAGVGIHCQHTGGGSNIGNGEIGVLLVYDGAHDTTTRQSVEQWIIDNFGF